MRQGLVYLAVAALAASASALSALAHSLGEARDGSLPPPLVIEMREAEALAKDLGASSHAARGGIDGYKLWTSGQILKACFFDGEDKLKDFFVTTSKIWTTGTSLAIDFGASPHYSACDPQKPDEIRISFTRPGSWSYIGTDSLRYDLDSPSLNVDYPQSGPWESLDKNQLAHLILHELGHALALEHEHQSPEANCDAEFDWDRIYPAYARMGWDKKKTDFNMRTILNEPRIRWTPYDKQSIMHYYFEPWMFKKGPASSCYVGNNLVPSAVDLTLVRAAYPLEVASQDDHLQDKANRFSTVLATQKPTVAQLTRIAQEVKTALEGYRRPVSLQFDLEKATGTRGPGAPVPELKDCDAGPSSAANVSCQVASDASGFVLNITPKP